MKRLIVYPYKMGSGSASLICEAVRAHGYRAMKVYPDRNYRPKPQDVILNWGSSIRPPWSMSWITRNMGAALAMINDPENVALASNKLASLGIFMAEEVPTLVYTTDQQEVNTWLSEGHSVVVRHKLTGHSGDGIEVLHPSTFGNDDPPVPVAPLYTKYFKRAAEYRVHVFNGHVIDWQQKLRRRDYEGEVDNEVRNHSNGWVYARDAATSPDQRVLDAAVAAVQALGLDFGAADVAWNQYHEQPAVFEVNTAPGLIGSTLTNYVNAIVLLLED